MKLCYNVYGKDAGHINTKDSPQNRGSSVNNAGLFALRHETNCSFPIKLVILIIDRSPKLVEYFRQAFDFRSQLFNRFGIIIFNGILNFLK